jgi:hypothetical protein
MKAKSCIYCMAVFASLKIRTAGIGYVVTAETPHIIQVD